MEVITKQVFCLFIQLVLPFYVLCAGIPYGNRHHFIESPKWSKWGEWGKLEHCPSDQVVVGMKLKVHENQGVKDDTGLNAVKFYCQNPYSSTEYAEDRVAITSLVGNYGVWKEDFFCPAAAAGSAESKLIAVGFQLRSETSAGVKDDTAGNNLKLVCSDLYQKQGYTYVEGDGTQRGEWTERQLCWPGYAICGLQTQVETSRSIDTTGLNNMKVRCCKADSGYNFHIASNNANTTSTSHHHDSVESNSSSENSSESSDSGEKDNGTGNLDEHHQQHHRGDHAASVEDSAEGMQRISSGDSLESPDEQELIAIVDPEPTEEHDETVLTVESSFVSTSQQNHTSAEAEIDHSPLSTSSSSAEVESDSGSKEDDDNLPEEIAQIDQVDNSEAHHEEEENVSTVTDSQQHTIPEEVVNALEDADSADSPSSQNDHHHHSYPFNDRPFHWGTELTNGTDLSGITDMGDETNSLEKEPKSSPRFGQIGENTTTTVAMSNHASYVSNSWRSLSVGPLVIFYVVKLVL